MSRLTELTTMLRWAIPGEEFPFGSHWLKCMDLLDQIIDEAVRMETAAYERGRKEGSGEERAKVV